MSVAPYDRFEIVGRYALYGEIASGDMATVHFGRLLGPAGACRPVAVKRLRARLAKDPRVRAALLDEARRVSRIRHPNVVSTLDVVAAAGQLLLVMDYVHGETLARLASSARTRRKRIPLPIILSIITDVLHGLHAAHEAKSESGAPLAIVHRDVSPQNVIVGVDGVARVLDFGIVRAAERIEHLDEGRVNGKLAYMAPEQLGETPLTCATDLYAAAVVLWELLAGRRLFVRDDHSPSVLLDKLMHGPIERPSMYDPSLPDALDAIVLRALARKPAARFASARQMATAIAALGELATATEVGDWVERSASEALRERSIGLAELDRASAPPRTQQISAYDVDVHIEPAIEEGPPSSEPPPMIAASDTYPVTDPRTLLFIRTPSSLPVIARPRVRRVPWREVAGVLVAAVVGVAGDQTLTHSIDGHRERVAEPPRPAAALAVAPTASACGPGMLEVGAATFLMGADDGLPFERPAHRVTVAPFCIDRFETTTDDYRACSDAGSCKPPPTSNEWSGLGDRDRRALDPLCNARDPVGRAKHPINCVDWEMASRACRSRGARLPTEAEWELAARGPDGRKYPWGDDEPSATLLNACGRECTAWGKNIGLDLATMFSADDGFATTAPVGSFPAGASRYGVEDLVGNVSEWVADRYGDYPKEARSNPTGPGTGDERVVRGGAWNGSLSAWARPTFRTKEAPTKRSYAIGFRCASPR